MTTGTMAAIPSCLDHLVLATPRLDETLDALEAATGVRPLAGGVHPAWGTRNAILPLSPDTYLEIIGPDTTAATRPTIFLLDTLAAPRLVTWAAKGSGLPALTDRARSSGIELGTVTAGSRVRPDGKQLSWELTDPLRLPFDGILPFFIDWGSSPHPAASALAAVTLQDFHAEHPNPDHVRGALATLGVDLRVERATRPQLVARLATPRGEVALSLLV